MTYHQILNRLILKELEIRANIFANSFKPGGKSVVLVPGGMGSKLLQSSAPVQSGSAYPENPAFREIWVSWPSILRGHIAELELGQNEHDYNDRPIIASGEMNTIVKSYDKTEKFFNTNGMNYTEFGFDWRRDVAEAADYLKQFLSMIRDKVMARDLPNPLPELTLFAHSMGGIVTKLLINELVDEGEITENWFYRFVSVGTPFYGTESHIQRYYSGDRLVNILLGGISKVARMVSTMPGPYILIPAPKSVLEPRYSSLGLDRYPVRDEGVPTREVDPFQNRNRFPDAVVNNYLFRAEDIFRRIDQPLPDNTRDQVFHLRNNIKGTDNLEFIWQDVDGSAFDYNVQCPIENNKGASDCTVPFWSARLGNTPDDHVCTIGTETKHGDLAEDDKTLHIVKNLAQGFGFPDLQELSQLPSISTAADHEVENIINDINSGAMTADDMESQPEDIKRKILNCITLSA